MCELFWLLLIICLTRTKINTRKKRKKEKLSLLFVARKFKPTIVERERSICLFSFSEQCLEKDELDLVYIFNALHLIRTTWVAHREANDERNFPVVCFFISPVPSSASSIQLHLNLIDLIQCATKISFENNLKVGELFATQTLIDTFWDSLSIIARQWQFAVPPDHLQWLQRNCMIYASVSRLIFFDLSTT